MGTGSVLFFFAPGFGEIRRKAFLFSLLIGAEKTNTSETSAFRGLSGAKTLLLTFSCFMQNALCTLELKKESMSFSLEEQ